jgi:hypothetical protein
MSPQLPTVFSGRLMDGTIWSPAPPSPKSSPPEQTRLKLQIDEKMWNGFDLYYCYLDRINRIIRNLIALGEWPFG